MVVRGIGSEKYLKLLPSAAAYQDTTLIWGPYYRQDIKYFTSLDGIYRDVEYNADYDMKLEWNLPTADTAAYYNPSIPICRVQVTQSYALTTQTLGCTYPIVDSILTLEKFLELNQWKKFSFHYKLDNDSCSSAPGTGSPQPMTDYMSDFRMLADETPIRQDRQYIQFKVIWYGNPNFLLSIDKVTIYDERGSNLKFQAFPTTQIYAQDDLLNNHYDYITGYIGFDEPTSIDIAEPVRIVKEILDSESNQKRPLWLPWMGFWDGAFESRNNTFGSMRLSPWVEFNKRVGSANIIQDAYLYDLPCSDSVVSLYPNLCAGDWRITNIQRMVDFQYKQASKLDPYWGDSIQCGEDTPPYGNSYQRNIKSHEFLYNVNLALMYGAKFIDLYTYFPRNDFNSDPCYLCNAIINWTSGITNDIKTDKYFTLRDTINPRLRGLFGRTLKKLIPFEDTLGINPSTNYILNFNKIENVGLANYNGSEALNSLIEIGTFKMPQESDDDYFMIVNRYYSDAWLNQFYINLRNLYGYKNWNLFNYVDTTGVTILPNIDGEAQSPIDTIVVGDAILYSIKPVVEFGGRLQRPSRAAAIHRRGGDEQHPPAFGARGERDSRRQPSQSGRHCRHQSRHGQSARHHPRLRRRLDGGALGRFLLLGIRQGQRGGDPASDPVGRRRQQPAQGCVQIRPGRERQRRARGVSTGQLPPTGQQLDRAARHGRGDRRCGRAPLRLSGAPRRRRESGRHPLPALRRGGIAALVIRGRRRTRVGRLLDRLDG